MRKNEEKMLGLKFNNLLTFVYKGTTVVSDVQFANWSPNNGLFRYVCTLWITVIRFINAWGPHCGLM
jgi:hypothetical protein